MKKVILMLAVAAMASCSKSEVETRPVAAGDVEIQAISNALSIETKAPFENGITSTNTLTAYVLASTQQGKYLDSDATTWWGAGNITFSDESTQVGFTPDKLYYPANGASVYLFGLYPTDATTPGNGWTIDNTTGATATYTINGCTDIMAAKTATTKKADVVVAAGAPKIYPTLKFKHLLTKLDIYVTATKAAADAFGKITKLELKDAKNLCTVTFNADPTDDEKTGAEVTDGTSAFTVVADNTTCPFYRYDYSATAPAPVYTDDAVNGTDDKHKIDLANIENQTNNTAWAAYAMVNPVYVGVGNMDNPYVLSITTSTGYTKDDVNVKLYSVAPTETNNGTLYSGSTQGKQFKVTLNFTATEIKASATVKPWGTTGVADTTVPVQ